MKMARLIGLASAIGAALSTAACNIEGNAPMRSQDIVNVAKTGAPIAITTMVTATFASKDWCDDEGAMAIRQLGSAGTPIVPTGCSKAGGHATGQFQVTTNLVRTAGAKDHSVAVEDVLGGDLVRFAVFPHAQHKSLLSVGIFLNIPKFEKAKASLLQMPVFRMGDDLGEQTYAISISVANDLPKPARFYLKDVGAGGDLPSDDSVLTIPPGGSDTIALDPETQAKLMQQGYVNFFAMAAP